MRIKKALADKLPKLRVYARGGMTTVLVLESDDIALSNEALISAAVREELSESNIAPPDAIYLVDTSMPSMWIVICLKYGTATWPETAPHGADYPRFDPEQLSDILRMHNA